MKKGVYFVPGSSPAVKPGHIKSEVPAPKPADQPPAVIDIHNDMPANYEQWDSPNFGPRS